VRHPAVRSSTRAVDLYTLRPHARDSELRTRVTAWHDDVVDENDPVMRELMEKCRREHAAWIHGDGSPYALPDEGTIMGAVGGFSYGGDDTTERQRGVAAQWRSGSGSLEFVNGGVDGDLAWIAMIERATVNFAADPPEVERRWDLRATEVFRRTAGTWQRVHRHADPLVDRRPVAEVAHLLA
jgi:ketosteroid isomerase-like protein